MDQYQNPLVGKPTSEQVLNNSVTQSDLERCGNLLAIICHGVAKEAGWWRDPATGEPVARNQGELLMLIVSEVAEAMEGLRKNLPDDKLPHRPMVEVELADALIRIFDMAGAYGYDVAGALVEKLQFNINRADHKPENRVGENGKKF